jgi:hypothetical protein
VIGADTILHLHGGLCCDWSNIVAMASSWLYKKAAGLTIPVTYSTPTSALLWWCDVMIL